MRNTGNDSKRPPAHLFICPSRYFVPVFVFLCFSTFVCDFIEMFSGRTKGGITLSLKVITINERQTYLQTRTRCICSRIHRGERSGLHGTAERHAGQFPSGKSGGGRCTDRARERCGRHEQGRRKT